MVDMATPYDEYPDQDSQFAQMRDSLYILSVMNQCKYSLRLKLFCADRTYFADCIRRDLMEEDNTMIAAEKLLRIALFSDELPMQTEATLTGRRKKLAESLRAFRKKGEIPVFVSTLWFLLALAISIESAFRKQGTNQAAHNLALGLLLTFIPIFILSWVHLRSKRFPFEFCILAARHVSRAEGRFKP